MLILRRSIAYLKISGITFHIFIRLSTISLYGRELKKSFELVCQLPIEYLKQYILECWSDFFFSGEWKRSTL